MQIINICWRQYEQNCPNCATTDLHLYIIDTDGWDFARLDATIDSIPDLLTTATDGRHFSNRRERLQTTKMIPEGNLHIFLTRDAHVFSH